VTITLREITEDNAESVLALRTTPEQEQFVSTVAYSLTEARENPEGNPWFRAVYADERPVGFVMLSWDVEPRPPDGEGARQGSTPDSASSRRASSIPMGRSSCVDRSTVDDGTHQPSPPPPICSPMNPALGSTDC
jgi:hypothetical protein